MAALRSSETLHRWIGVAEWVVAGGLTLGAVALQVVNWRHAGGLWRDEAAAVNLAQMPSWSAVWANLEHESFPLLITTVIRLWTALGFGSTDGGLRALGLLISVGLLGAIWWSGWTLSRRPPLFSLLLVGLSPVAIRWGGSLRAYGLGVLLALAMVTAIWQLLTAVTLRRFVVALALSVLAVHTLYQNALVLLAACLSAAAVTLLRRDRRAARAVAMIAAASGLSLLPYVGVIRRASEWNEATHVAIDVERMWTVLHRALAASGTWMPLVWGALIVLALAAAARSLRALRSAASRSTAERSAFLLIAALGLSSAYYVFLNLTKFPTEEWYYLLWMAMIAFAVEAVLATACGASPLRWLRPVSAAIIATLAFPNVVRAVQVRATNVDLIATHLNGAVRGGDVLLLHPWFCAPSLTRYYSGPATLLTLPPIADHKLQRLDLLKEQMRNEDTIRPVLAAAEATLRAGGTVWLVGHFPFANPPRAAPALPRAGEGPEGWRAAPYMTAYGMDVAYFLQMNALRSTRVEVPTSQQVHPFEALPVRTISGWRQSRSPW